MTTKVDFSCAYTFFFVPLQRKVIGLQKIVTTKLKRVMKKILLLFILSLSSVLYTTAQIQYAVKSNQPLAVRSKTDPKSKVLGKIKKGSIVDVYEVSKTYGANWKEYCWATIKYKGKTAYVDFESLVLSQAALQQIDHVNNSKRRILYKVTSNQALDVTSRSSLFYGERKGRVYPGDTVEVYSIETQEGLQDISAIAKAVIRFDGRKRHVNAFGIQPCQDTRRKEFAPLDVDTKRGAIANIHWMFFIILILWIACGAYVLAFPNLSKHFTKEEEEKLEKANMFVFFIVSVLEIIYVLVMWNESLWVFDNMPYLLELVLFLTFIAIIIFQIIDFMLALETADEYEGTDLRLGIASWIIFIITTALYTIFSWEKGYTIAIAVFALCQLIQLIIILKTLIPSIGLSKTLWYVTLYVIGSIGTVMLFTFAAVVLIALIVVGLVVMLFFNGLDFFLEAPTGKVGHLGGNGKSIAGIFSRSGETFYGNDGSIFDKLSNGKFLKR